MDYHIRSKGINDDCVKIKAKEMKIDVMELYERLFKGEEI